MALLSADRSLVQQYEDAVRTNAPTKDYLAQMVAASAGMSIAGVSAAPVSALQPMAPLDDSFLGGFLKGLKNGLTDNPLANTISGVTDAAKATGSAIDFITDIPRVITTVLGMILIIAGIFALASSGRVQAIAQRQLTS